MMSRAGNRKQETGNRYRDKEASQGHLGNGLISKDRASDTGLAIMEGRQNLRGLLLWFGIRIAGRPASASCNLAHFAL